MNSPQSLSGWKKNFGYFKHEPARRGSLHKIDKIQRPLIEREREKGQRKYERESISEGT